MRKITLFAGVLLAAALLLAAAPQKAARTAQALPPPAVNAMKSIDPDRIRAHVKFLADDLLEGRGTGQRGGDIAAQYIATQFELAGLEPAAGNGSYLQKVPLVGISTQPESKVSLQPAKGEAIDLRLRDDIVVMDETQGSSSDVDAEIVFVGYGIEAPEYKWNDYKDADVKGKVLLMLVNEPPSEDEKVFKGKALTYYGRWTYKFEQAARQGAVGALIVHKTDMASYGWDVVKNSWSGERSYLRQDDDPKLKLASWIQLDVARKIASASGKELDQMMQDAKSADFRPVTLPVRVKAQVVSKVRPFDSFNVVAKLPGSDAKLKQQAVLYSAHWDHLGVRPGEGDNIYNGAVDNATGCAILMEMARVLAGAPQKPKRSMIFAAVTAEEQGLRGSEFLGKNPPMPARNIVLGLNFDGLAPIGVPQSIEVVGSERTSFYPVLETTARDFKFEIAPDSNPGAGFYYRSDHFSLARVGIPAFSVNQGMKYKGREKDYGEKWEKEYNEKHYHQPSDQYRPDMDFAGNAVIARFGVALGWKAASLPQEIRWQPGDEFEAARKASQGATTKGTK